MIKRDLEETLKRISEQYPAITLTGPRQSGKTTILKKVFTNKPYFNMEEPDTRLKFISDPRGFLKQLPFGAIFDEFQNVPELPSYLQSIIDEKQSPGLFILSGSQQLEIINKVSQSLAGRTAIVKLLPLTLSEVSQVKNNLSLNELLLNGFYPRLYDKNLEPELLYKSYFETYIQRDLHQLMNIKHLDQFQRFVHLCAGRIGNIFVASQLANEIGVSVPTIQNWLSILEASYIIFFLSPYFSNINKRIIKAPKIYFYDVGFASYLLNIQTIEQMDRDPLRGALFENLVILELIKKQYNQAKESNLFFYRDQSQNEVDVIIKKGHELIPIEIKLSSTFNPSLFKNLKYFKKIFPDQINNQYLVYTGQEKSLIQDVQFINFKDLNKML